MTRGIPRGATWTTRRCSTEAELRYDVTNRWSLIGFGGVGRVADNFGDLGSADNHVAVGTGFRYLVARQYGMRMGLDVGYGDDGDWTVYVTMGTGWVQAVTVQSVIRRQPDRPLHRPKSWRCWLSVARRRLGGMVDERPSACALAARHKGTLARRTTEAPVASDGRENIQMSRASK